MNCTSQFLGVESGHTNPRCDSKLRPVQKWWDAWRWGRLQVINSLSRVGTPLRTWCRP